MDALTRSILDTLIDKGGELAKDLVLRGVQLVRDRVDGRASDAAVMQWLRDAQDGIVS